MAATAEILADSINRTNSRITTFSVVFSRMILPELLTHRMLSKNTASSRAIPVEKMIESVLLDPAMPAYWGKNQKGMSAREELTGDAQLEAKAAWLRARDRAVESARELYSLGLHKQLSNRPLDPFFKVKMIITATDFDNFFALRCHEDAQPEIQELALAMREAMRSSVPKFKTQDASDWTGWHLPLVSEAELTDATPAGQFKNLIRSVARCARVSYDKVEGGVSEFDNDLRIFKSLGESVPAHWSPFEHQAFPALQIEYHYNLCGWQSFRWHLSRHPKWFNMIVESSMS